MKSRYLVVGAGLSGCVLAEQMAKHSDCQIDIIDSRSHLAGNSHTQRSAETDVLVHEYGPHIFNTSHIDVWEYVKKFVEIMPYVNRVKVSNDFGIFSFPINLHTINQFYGKRYAPTEARKLFEDFSKESAREPRNFEEQAIKLIGRGLYEAFIYGYTKKQWGCEPSLLPASILKRLPIRFNYNDNYYLTKFQGIPKEGYTELARRLVASKNIHVSLGVKYSDETRKGYDHVFYSGAVDEYFGYEFGPLSYRTLEFERLSLCGDFQGNAVINYTSMRDPWTRIHEHKYFAPWEEHDRTIVLKEISREYKIGDIPFYPMRRDVDMELFRKYENRVMSEKNITFMGRLGTYRYLDMDQVIGEALDLAEIVRRHSRELKTIPIFGPRREK